MGPSEADKQMQGEPNEHGTESYKPCTGVRLTLRPVPPFA